MKVLKLLKEDRTSFILLSVSFLSSLVGLIFYGVSQSKRNQGRNWRVLFPTILSRVRAFFVRLFKDYDSLILTFSSALSFFAFIRVISSQAINLGYYFAGIKDIGYGLRPTFVVAFVFYLLSVVLTSVCVFRIKNEKEITK